MWVGECNCNCECEREENKNTWLLFFSRVLWKPFLSVKFVCYCLKKVSICFVVSIDNDFVVVVCMHVYIYNHCFVSSSSSLCLNKLFFLLWL